MSACQTVDEIVCPSCLHFGQCDASPYMFFAEDKIALQCRKCRNIWKVGHEVNLESRYSVEQFTKMFGIDFSEHICFDHDCVRFDGVEYHKSECPKSIANIARADPPKITGNIASITGTEPVAPTVEAVNPAPMLCDDFLVNTETGAIRQKTWRDRSPML